MNKTNQKSLFCVLLVAALAMYFCCFNNNIAIMAYIWPLCMIYFIRHSNNRYVGIALATLVAILVFELHNMYYFQGEVSVGSVLFNAAYPTLYFIPFILDGILYGKMNKKVQVLLLPLAYAVIEYVICLLQINMMDNLAYSQGANLVFVQFASLIGTYGCSGLIIAFSSVMEYVIENNFKWESVKNVVVTYLAVLLVLNVYGGYRNSTYNRYNEDKMTVALAQGPDLAMIDGEWTNVTYEENVESLKETFYQAADFGVDMIVYNEEAFCVANTEYEDLLAEIKALAIETGVYAFVPVETYDDDGSDNDMGYNKEVLVSDKGVVLIDYEKSRLVPQVETGYYVKGDSVIPTAEVKVNGKSAKVSATICYDAHFSDFIRTQDNDVAIWISPSWEWVDICNYTLNSIIFRCVENGVSSIKPTYEGYSVVLDSNGNINMTDNYVLDKVAIAEVSTNPRFTVYGAAGNLINYGYVAALVAVIAIGLKKKED